MSTNNSHENVVAGNQRIHPDDLEDLRNEARLNVEALVKGGDVALEDANEAFEDELERMLEA